MSVGRHARKRAAQQAEQTAITENRLLQEQEATLKKEEAKKTALDKDIESQRIATMRARFGGQVPQQSTNSNATESPKTQGVSSRSGKNRTPSAIMGQTPGTADPMRNTILSMMLGNDNEGA